MSATPDPAATPSTPPARAELPATTARATLLVMASAACFGAIPILTSVALRTGAPLTTVLSWRYLLAALLLTIAAGGARGVLLPWRRALPLLALGGGGQALVGYVSLSALHYIPAAALSFLFYTYPAWVAGIAALRRTEPLTLPRMAALALSLLGILLMVGRPWASMLAPIGVVLALGSAVLFALYIPLLRRMSAGLAPATATVHVALGAGGALMAGGALGGTPVGVTLVPAAWMAIGLLALVSTALAFTLYLRGLATLGPVRTSIVSTIEPFWTAVLGALVLAQPLTSVTIVGGALIAAAVYLLQRGGLERKSTPVSGETGTSEMRSET